MQSMLTIAQVCKLTGKHPETIRRWCRERKVKSEKKRPGLSDIRIRIHS